MYRRRKAFLEEPVIRRAEKQRRNFLTRRHGGTEIRNRGGWHLREDRVTLNLPLNPEPRTLTPKVR
jgi:hypothetical protein